MANVGKRYSSAGGSEKGTPARATQLGSSEMQASEAYHTNTIASQKGYGEGGTGGKATQGSGTAAKDASTPVEPGKQGTEGRSGKDQHHGNSKSFPLSAVFHAVACVRVC